MQRLIRPAWLLRQADELGYRLGGPGQPRNSNLRRAVSASYYALFHGIGWAMAVHLLPNSSDEERARLTRSLNHDAIRNVFRWVAKGDVPPPQIAGLVPVVQVEVAVVDLADGFLELRDQRHAADYDHLADFTKEGVLNLVDTARAGVVALEQLQADGSDSLARFLVLTSLKTRIR